MRGVPSRCYTLIVLSEARTSLYVTIFSWNLNVAMKHEALSRLVYVRRESFATCILEYAIQKLLYTILHNTIRTAEQKRNVSFYFGAS